MLQFGFPSFVERYTKASNTKKYKWLQRVSNKHSNFRPTWPVWRNGWVFVYELSGCEFESRCSHLNFRYRACFEQGVPRHTGNYRVCIHSKTCIWYDRNIQTKKYTCAIVVLVDLQFNPYLTKLSHCAKYRNFTWFTSWEILRKRTVSCPKIWGNCASPENVHTRKLGETTVFYVISFISILLHVLWYGKAVKEKRTFKGSLSWNDLRDAICFCISSFKYEEIELILSFKNRIIQILKQKVVTIPQLLRFRNLHV